MAKHKHPSRPGWNGALVALGNGLLLLCALLGLLWSFLSLYGIVSHQDVLAVSSIPDELLLCHTTVLTALCVGLALLTLATWSLPRFRLVVFGGLCVVWAAVVYWLRQAVVQGALLVWQAIANLLYERCGWGEYIQFSLDLTLQERSVAVTLFLALALSLLALLLGWAVVRARRWWLVVLLTLPPLLPGLLCDVYPSWPAFLTLCACWCAMLLTSLCKWAAPARRGLLTLAVLPCVGTVLVLLSLALPMEGYSRPQWARSAEAALVSFGNQHLSFLADWTGPFSNRATFVGSAETVDLNSAGPLRYTGRTVLNVTSDYTGRVYLRGTSLARYEDNQWLDLEDGAYDEYIQAAARNMLSPGVPLTFPASTMSGARQYTITVENVGASGSCVYAPYQLADQDWDGAGVLPVEDSYLARRRGEWTQTLAFLPDLAATPPGTAFPEGSGASWSLPADTDAALDNLSRESFYRDFVWTYYLDVPKELEDTLWQVLEAEETISGYLPYIYSHGDPYHYGYAVPYVTLAQAVADLLDELCDYDPRAPRTPEGEDFVAYFLTESHRGYCMHFASSATLMLRALGIPARYVSGFTAQLAEGETVAVPDSAAHAWVEIYLDGYGWYPVEVTPSYESPDVTESASPSPSLAPSLVPSQAPEASQAPDATPTPGQSAGANGDGASQTNGSALQLLRLLGPALACLAGAAAIVGLVWLGQYLPKRLRTRRLSSPDTNQAVLAGYRCLTRLKKWGGTVPHEALELARKARFSQHTLTEEERQTMLCLLNAERAHLARRLSWWKRPLFRYLWGVPTDTGPDKEDTTDAQP